MLFDVSHCLVVLYSVVDVFESYFFFFFQAEDGIRDLVRSRGLGDVYKRQVFHQPGPVLLHLEEVVLLLHELEFGLVVRALAVDLSLIHI
mgnify:CR=1 FL=1